MESACENDVSPPEFFESLRSFLDHRDLVPPQNVGLNGTKCLFLLRRFHITNSPHDLAAVSNLALDFISLNDVPEFAPYFFYVASRSLDFYEKYTDSRHLENAIEILQRFMEVQQQNSPRYLMVGTILSSAFMLYYLREGTEAALDECLQLFEGIIQSSEAVPWKAPFGTEKTLLFLGDVVRHRYEADPSEDFKEAVSIVVAILHLFPSHDLLCVTTIESLVLSTILNLSQITEYDEWISALQHLQRALQIYLATDHAILPPISESADDLIDALDECIPKTTNRATCLIYQANLLQCKGKVEDMPQSLVNLCSEDDVAAVESLWLESWEEDCTALKEILRSNQDFHLPPTTHHIFQFNSELITRPPRAGRIRLCSLDPIETHNCTFSVALIPGGKGSKPFDIAALTHEQFVSELENKCKSWTRNELDSFIDNFGDFHPPHRDVIPTDWVESPAVRACLHYARYMRHHRHDDLSIASKVMLTTRLDKEPGYSHLLYDMACTLRNHEADSGKVDTAAKLFKEFLRVQERGTAKHFMAVIELASTMVLQWLLSGDLYTFAAALELFRESLCAHGYESWSAGGRDVMILGRILHTRFRCFNASEESLQQSVRLIGPGLKLISQHRPFYYSTVEIITASTFLLLAETLPTIEWQGAVSLFARGLTFYVIGSHQFPDTPSQIQGKRVVDSVLEGGLDNIHFSLSNQAMCVIHISDVLRSAATNTSRYPSSLAISLEMYQRSLGLSFQHSSSSDGNSQTDTIYQLWYQDIDRLREAIILISTATEVLSNKTLAPYDDEAFGYHATRLSLSQKEHHVSHHCYLRYNVIDVAPKTMACLPSITMKQHLGQEPWPEVILASEQVTNMPSSSLMPWIDGILSKEDHPIFSMPLESRTIKAFIRLVGSEVRQVEGMVSDLSEAFIHSNSGWVSWDPRDISFGAQLDRLKGRSSYLARTGPLRALLSRGAEKSLELVEESRALFWTRLLRLKVSFDGLPEPIKHQLEEARSQLDHHKLQSATRPTTLSDQRQQWGLEGSFERLIRQARNIPGFHDFLLPKTSSYLMSAAVEGPIVVLLGSDSTYAAILVRTSAIDAIHLSSLTEKMMNFFLHSLQEANGTARSMDPDSLEELTDDRRGRLKISPASNNYSAILAGMWTHIVKPILNKLEISSAVALEERQRLWWCPTGLFSFLPIHAAGMSYKKDKVERLSDYVVSSYIPTIASLITARQNQVPKSLCSQLKTLVLAQPTTIGFKRLPMTLDELKNIERQTPAEQIIHVGAADTPLFTSNANRTVGEAIEYLTQASILHLACHGQQDRSDPLNSGFQLDDGRLTLSKLISCQTPHAFLAFLSACESASNDLDIPDESMNLAAAMLYAGFRSVIGTMWTMNDNDGPTIASFVYEALFKDLDQKLDPALIPRALDAAIRALQDKGVHPSRWATYIHVGC